MSGVFISYARADQALAWRITSWLRTLDVHVWWDQDMTSVDWHYELVDRITDLAAVVVIWSPNSWTSKSVRDEARLADDQDKLVNLMIGVTKPLHPFDRIIGIDLEGWQGTGSNAICARVVVAIDRQLTKVGAIDKGTLIARQNEQFEDFKSRERELSAIIADLTAAEASAHDAMEAIETANAALVDAEADLANVKASGLSRSVAAAADAAARVQRDEAEQQLRYAREEATAKTEKVGALTARRDLLRKMFNDWQIERGAEDVGSNFVQLPAGLGLSPIKPEGQPHPDVETDVFPEESLVEPVNQDWSVGEVTARSTSMPFVADVPEYEYETVESTRNRSIIFVSAIGIAAAMLLVYFFFVRDDGRVEEIATTTTKIETSIKKTPSLDTDSTKASKGITQIKAVKTDIAQTRNSVITSTKVAENPVSVPAWLVGTRNRQGKCSVSYTFADGKKGLLLVTASAGKKTNSWFEPIISDRPNNTGQERIETDQTYYVRESEDAVISVVPKKSSGLQPFKLSSQC